MFLIPLLLAPVYYGVYSHFRTRLTSAWRANQESFSRITATLAESVTGIRVTQGFARQDLNAEMFTDLVQDHARFNLSTSLAGGAFNAWVELVGQVLVATIFAVGGYRALSHDPHHAAVAATAAVATLTVFYFQANAMLGPIAGFAQMYNTAVASMAGAERVFSMLDRPPEFTDEPDAADLPPITGKVEFRKITFAYDPGKNVLHDISFTARPGQTIALVGHTGSGKSSIINLISKFYLPQAGQILVDGHDLRKIRSASLHKQMGIVLQVNFLFSGTVIENIRMGKPGAPDEEVREAARKIDCLDLIEALPQGFETVVGERGGGLSLGQRQLICFARAMLADPRIMILDEATSSVDTVTEARIQKALGLLLKGRTSFVVAHRLSTIRHADVVLVLDHGRIVERGNHTELLATGGIYANLYMQFIQATTA
jgi:ATP-binding cassette subfamily B protein